MAAPGLFVKGLVQAFPGALAHVGLASEATRAGPPVPAVKARSPWPQGANWAGGIAAPDRAASALPCHAAAGKAAIQWPELAARDIGFGRTACAPFVREPPACRRQQRCGGAHLEPTGAPAARWATAHRWAAPLAASPRRRRARPRVRRLRPFSRPRRRAGAKERLAAAPALGGGRVDGILRTWSDPAQHLARAPAPARTHSPRDREGLHERA
jgi:hypothetical protein